MLAFTYCTRIQLKLTRKNKKEVFAQGSFEEDTDIFPMLSLDANEEALPDALLEEALPVLPLKNTVLFPSIVIPITIGRDKSIQAIRKAYEGNKLIVVLSQKEVSIEEPGSQDLYMIGTGARILRMLKMPDGTTTAILRGLRRVEVLEMTQEDPTIEARVKALDYQPISDSITFEALIDSIRALAHRAIELSPDLPSEANMVLENIEDPTYLINFIAGNINAGVEIKQAILAQDDLATKAMMLVEQLQRDLEILKIRDKIESKTRIDIEKQQRDYFLHQQMKAIQEELGQHTHLEEVQQFELRGARKEWPQTVKLVFEREIQRLKRMNPQAAEFSVQLNYIETLLDLPWLDFTADNFDLKNVQKTLDQDHYGLEKVKDRILSHLAVLKLKGDMKAPIILLIGPPGVGKTSLGKSIANALGRKFIRISLGGLHDESEIRGHRKTYIGAMPGRIVQSLKKAQAANPVFMLDEIDKIGNSHRGDPSSALLEVLDPEQNSSFHDNYLDLDIDLSKVLFIATANSLSTIQPALLDRMEVIYISGYSQEEKLEIAKHHLLSKQREAHGLKTKQVKVPVKTLKAIIDGYTRESGVRSLDRQLAATMRYAAKQIAFEEVDSVTIEPDGLPAILGPQPFSREQYAETGIAGIAIGLAWTSVGGEILFVEASLSPGKGQLTQTGNLGNVMKESATTALSYLKSHAKSLGIEPEQFSNTDIHIHVPEGATPKDGPSAGITIMAALASAFTARPLRPRLAMTGEITLRGKVLPVGGIKEKILAARRAGMKEIILCEANRPHVEEIEEQYTQQLQFHYIKTMQEVLAVALLPVGKK